MFLKAGALSLALLVASRLLGLARESALAAAFGASGVADIVVLMLTFPDWLAGVLASGALAYVLVPAWARQTAGEVGAIQRRLTWVMAGVGCALALALFFLRVPVAAVLAPGAPPGQTSLALAWSALALPAALMAALWSTRLQHERDFSGMYAANLVVNGVLIAAIVTALWNAAPITWVGVGLLVAVTARLFWLRLRMPRAAPAAAQSPVLPAASVWWWAALAAGLPLALPFAARSIASQSGEGALATFNYAWKLVELPLVLAVQLVGVLALPAIAWALAGPDPQRTATAVRSSFALAWTLACAAAAGLLVAAPAVARLLFGWGRMDPESLAQVATWGALGAWSLLPQAVIAVAINVLAARGQMRSAVFGYAFALGLLLAAGALGVRDGGWLMLALDVLFVMVACAVLWALRGEGRAWLPGRAVASSSAVLLAVTLAAVFVPLAQRAQLGVGLAFGAAAAALVIGLSWWASEDLRTALAR